MENELGWAQVEPDPDSGYQVEWQNVRGDWRDPHRAYFTYFPAAARFALRVMCGKAVLSDNLPPVR